MAYEELYWPESLPSCSLINGYSCAIASNIVRTEMDTGAARQRSRGSIVLEPLEVSFFINSVQLDTLREFCHSAGGRSFWMPFPDPHDSRYDNSNLRLVRLKPKSDAITTPRPIKPGLFQVDISIEFWSMWPGKPRPEAGGNG